MSAESSKASRLSGSLESDLRLLSAETRRSEGFTSWLTGPDFPQIKEAAERGVLKLRSVTGMSDDSAEAVQKSKVSCCLPPEIPSFRSLQQHSFARSLSFGPVVRFCITLMTNTYMFGLSCYLAVRASLKDRVETLTRSRAVGPTGGVEAFPAGMSVQKR